MKIFAYWPLALLLAGATLLADLTPLDRLVAQWFYDPQTGGFPARHAFWAERLLHRGGIWLIAAIAVVVLAALVASLRWARLRPARGALLYLLACMALTTGGVALLKKLGGVDCPWDMQPYGGDRPYARVFEHSGPLDRTTGACFPGAHSSGAFSLLALPLLLARRRHPAAAPTLLAVFGLGLIYALCQWARGAHLPSHDLASAFIGWTVAHLLARLLLPPLARRSP